MSGQGRRSPGLIARLAFKRLWTLQPFNALATNAIRRVLGMLGRDIGRAGYYLPHSRHGRGGAPQRPRAASVVSR